MDERLTSLAMVLGACERIRNTPLPFAYTLLLHRTAYLYCFLLPFGLVDTIGLMTLLVVAIVSYTFFGLDALGDDIEEPFGDLPDDLPPPVAPVDFCLMWPINLKLLNSAAVKSRARSLLDFNPARPQDHLYDN